MPIAKLAPFSSSSGDLFSNDYLSLTSNEEFKLLFIKTLAASMDILGSKGSRLMGGNTPSHLASERLRDLYSAPAALLFNSGYHANISVFGSLPQSGDIIIFDEYIHASCHDGMAISRAKHALIPFKHNSLPSLKECLLQALELNPGIKAGQATVFVAVEGLYSMDGDIAPLAEIVEIMRLLLPAKCLAHSTGVYGDAGRGLVSLMGLEGEVHTRVHTFGKALGSAGAVALTTPVVRSYLINYARSFIYTTSLPLRLAHLCRYFRDSLLGSLKPIPTKIMSLANTGVENTVSPIFPILVCDPLNLERFLQARGYDAKAIPYPIVPRGKERIRICIHAGNTEEELLQFVSELVSWA
ncbi:PLP-dependent transferase [Mycena polygramma]|nr:PLP-dependent transferase [Mycena polygramma]